MSVELTIKQIILLILMIVILAIVITLGVKYSTQIKTMFLDLFEVGGTLTS